jgi:hypothetical protein
MEIFNAFIALVKQYALKSIVGLSGFRAWVAKLIIDQVVKLLIKIGVGVAQKEKAKKELKEYEQVINKPNLPVEERRDADKDFLK